MIYEQHIATLNYHFLVCSKGFGSPPKLGVPRQPALTGQAAVPARGVGASRALDIFETREVTCAIFDDAFEQCMQLHLLSTHDGKR